MCEKKKYLFASYTDFTAGKPTGAHRRFLELLNSVAESNDVVFVGLPTDEMKVNPNIEIHVIDKNTGNMLPKHLAGGYALLKKLKSTKPQVDYAVSFSPVTTIAYYLAGIRHIVSLFREDLIGYQKALQASKVKLVYFQIQESLAVMMSEKIIVQCKSDRENLIARNRKYCKRLSDKVFIQINNANASWMNTDSIERSEHGGIPKILFVGNFSDRRKGHDILLPAIMRILDEGYKLELLCAGSGSELEYWRSKCSAYDSIRFLGHVSNMKEYLSQVDMMLVPSLIDSCPNTVLEGLNAGVAVYGANAGGIPDLLMDKEYMFEPDENSIYIFMKTVLDKEEYDRDAKTQMERRKELCFDWGERIRVLIEYR